MIIGFMNTSLEAIICLDVCGMDGQIREVEAVMALVQSDYPPTH